MNLQEFVSETLSQIMHGIVDAQVAVEQIGGKVNPLMSVSGDLKQTGNTIKRQSKAASRVSEVEFDVAITVTSENTKSGKASGKAGLTIFSASAEAGISAAQHEGSVSRVKFTIPIVCPPQGSQS